MADNAVLSAAVGVGITAALDDIGGVHYPRSKITIGADGVNDGDVSASNPLPVKGTGSAGTANAGVVTVQGIASMTPVQIADNGGSITVDGTVSVSGTVTVGSHAVTNAGTFACQIDGSALTALQLIDDPIATIGGVPLNRVAIYDAGGAQITSFGGGAQYTEGDTDATITGTAAMMEVAANTIQPIQGTVADGLLVNLGSNNDVSDGGGSLTVDAPVGTPVYVRLSNGAAPLETLPISAASLPSHHVTNIGTFAVQISDALPAGTNTIGKLASNATVNIGTVDIGSALPAGTNTIGKLGSNSTVIIGAVEIAAAQTIAVTDGGGSLTVDGTFFQATQPVSIAATVTVTGAGGTFPVTGTFWQATQPVSLASVPSHEITIAAAQTLATVTTVTTCSTVTTLTGSGVAHDAADSGNPHKIGARAVASVSGQTPVAANDRTDVFAGIDGVLITRQHSNLEDIVQERMTNTDGAATPFTSGLAAPGAGLRLWITGVCLCNSHATDNITVDLRDGAAGAVLWTLSVPAGGGNNWQFNPPLRLSANTALAFDGSAAVTTLSVSANGFKSKV